MKESYREGLANHPGPESCAGDGNIPGEALTGVHTGQLLSSESPSPACRPDSLRGKATPEAPLPCEVPEDAAESKNLRMCGNSMHENREAPSVSRGDDLERLEKDDRKSNMYADGDSDNPIVPRIRANNSGEPLAESVEERGLAKGSTSHKATYRAQYRNGVLLEMGGARTDCLSDKSSTSGTKTVRPFDPRQEPYESRLTYGSVRGWPVRAIPTATAWWRNLTA